MSATRPNVLLEHYLKQLKMRTMLREHAAVAATCSKENADYTTYPMRLAERQLLDREQRAAQRRLKAAKFPIIKTLDTFDFAAQPGINRKLILELTNGEYIRHKEDVLLIGNPGTGKTHLATSLGHAACSQGKRVRFLTVTGLVTHMIETREQRQLQRFLARLEQHHLLILDEFGYVPFSKTGAEFLFEVVSRAYERTSIIMTTNLPFEAWTQVLGNERLTGALLDRLTHRGHIIEANGENYRLKHAKKRRDKKNATTDKQIPSPP